MIASCISVIRGYSRRKRFASSCGGSWTVPALKPANAAALSPLRGGEMLAGRADRLKGYTIATAVFGREESFDPQTDPVVRLEAGTAARARALLSDRRTATIHRDRFPRADTRRSASGGNTRHWIPPAPAGEPAAAVLNLRRPATRGRAGIGSRPPSSPARCSGRWDGLARTCSLPDCGPAAAGTPRPSCLRGPRSPCCPS